MIELYLIKNERLIECVKTLWTILIFFFIFFIASNAYDILFFLFVWSFLPLIDWEAFTSDPYFFSLVVFITLFGIITIKVKEYKFNLFYLGIAFILYCICSPITEIFMFELNGCVNYICGFLNIIDKKDSYIFCNLSKEELECSYKKLANRCISILFLSFMIILITYLKKNTVNEELKNVYTSAIYLSIINIGYFIISVINQIYKLYFIKDNNKIPDDNIVVNEDINEYTNINNHDMTKNT
jgi:hypothetical protein